MVTSLTNIPIVISIKKQTRLFISIYSIEWNRFIVSVAVILQSDSMALRSISDEMSLKPREV
jgi:hypothetical protein